MVQVTLPSKMLPHIYSHLRKLMLIFITEKTLAHKDQLLMHGVNMVVLIVVIIAPTRQVIYMKQHSRKPIMV